MSRVRLFNIPNVLTVLRLVLLPGIIALFRADHFLLASGAFIGVMLTDVLDGYIAKRFNQCTRLGAYLDAVVDKIVILALFYELASDGLMRPAIAHYFLARELLHNAVRCTAASVGVAVGANWMGKVKACMQSITIAVGLAMPRIMHEVSSCGLDADWVTRPFTALVIGTLVLAWGFFFAFAWKNHALLAQE